MHSMRSLCLAFVTSLIVAVDHIVGSFQLLLAVSLIFFVAGENVVDWVVRSLR